MGAEWNSLAIQFANDSKLMMPPSHPEHDITELVSRILSNQPRYASTVTTNLALSRVNHQFSCFSVIDPNTFGTDYQKSLVTCLGSIRLKRDLMWHE